MKSKDQTLLEETCESIHKSVETIPIVGQIYNWTAYNSIVEIVNVEETKTPAKEYEDGSLSGPSTAYMIKIKDITPEGKYEGEVLRTPFTSAGFKLIK
jgi:hypothetical protein